VFLPANKKMMCVLIVYTCIQVACLNAQPKSNRSDITVKQLGTVGISSVRIRRDPASGNLYVVQNDGNIKRVDFGAGGAVSFTTVYQKADHGLNAPLGIAFGQDGTMFLVGNDSTTQFGTATIVKGVPDAPGTENRTWSIIATTVAYPFGNVYNHRMSGIVVDPTGDYIYVNSGAATDHGELRAGYREVGLTSIILKLPTSGQNIILQDDREWLRSNGYLMAEGIRNSFDFAYSGNGDLFDVQNSGDRDDPEEMNWIREGHHYGFPWRIGGNNTPQRFTPYNPRTDPLLSPNAWGGGNLYATFSNDPSYPPPPAGVTFTDPILSSGPDADKFRDTLTGAVKNASQLGLTIATFTPHRSPNGIVFDKDSVLAGDLKGGAFVICLANSGLVSALGDTSQDLLHIDLIKAGESYTAHVTRLVSGFNSPLGIELVGNKLYVVETGLWAGNNSPKLWEITLPTAISSVTRTVGLPGVFELRQNYPNPFNPSTTISFSTPHAENIKLVIDDMLGRQIRTLLSENVTSGTNSVQWDGKDANGMSVGSGVYFYQLKAASGFIKTRKMVLMK
jgi:hypothetical protein